MRQQQWMVISARVVSGLVSFVAGCSNGAEVALEDVPEALAPAYCGLLDCCGNPFTAQFLGGSGDCVTGIIPTLEDTFVARAQGPIASGTVIYHGELVSDCVGALEATGCGVETLEDGCSDVFEGTVALGGDCGWEEECADGYCSMSDGTCPGACAARVAAGAACLEAAACPVGFACDGGHCVALAREGEACSVSVACAGLDLSCVSPSGAGAGTCQSWDDLFAGAIGEPCSLASSDYCDPELSCVFDGVAGGTPSFVCAARVGRGEACAVGVPNPCPDEQFCDAEGTMGTCTNLPVAGEACTGICQGSLHCVSHEDDTRTCVEPRGLNEACTLDDECVSRSCQDGVCANPGC